VNHIIATGSPDSVGPSPLSSSSSYTSSGEMKTSTSPSSRPSSRALTPDWEDEVPPFYLFIYFYLAFATKQTHFKIKSIAQIIK
jgi:hypothetical protein